MLPHMPRIRAKKASYPRANFPNCYIYTYGAERRAPNTTPCAGRNAAPRICEIGSMLSHMPCIRAKKASYPRSNFPNCYILPSVLPVQVRPLVIPPAGHQLRTARRTHFLLAKSQAKSVIHITATRFAAPHGRFHACEAHCIKVTDCAHQC